MGRKNSKSEGFVSGLKTEWSLFWQTILTDEVETESDPSDINSKDPFENGKLESLSYEQIKTITRALSSDRKLLNQRLEALNQELEENAAKVESLKLVGGDFEQPLQKINELSDEGQTLSDKLDKINQRLRLAREREDEIKMARKRSSSEL